MRPKLTDEDSEVAQALRAEYPEHIVLLVLIVRCALAEGRAEIKNGRLLMKAPLVDESTKVNRNQRSSVRGKFRIVDDFTEQRPR